MRKFIVVGVVVVGLVPGTLVPAEATTTYPTRFVLPPTHQLSADQTRIIMLGGAIRSPKNGCLEHRLIAIQYLDPSGPVLFGRTFTGREGGFKVFGDGPNDGSPWKISVGRRNVRRFSCAPYTIYNGSLHYDS